MAETQPGCHVGGIQEVGDSDMTDHTGSLLIKTWVRGGSSLTILQGVIEIAETSWASSPGVRRSMQSNRGRDTALELRVRSALHRSGFRYRLHMRPVPGLRCTADVVFPRDRVALFIDGC